MATGRWGRSLNKEEAEELQVGGSAKRPRRPRKPRPRGEKNKQKRERVRAPPWCPFKEHKVWPARLSFLYNPATSSAARRPSIMGRKSRPGRKARGRDGRKAGLRCRKPRPKSCERVGWGAVPAGSVEGGPSAVAAASAHTTAASWASVDRAQLWAPHVLRRPLGSAVLLRASEENLTRLQTGWGSKV